MEIVVKLLVDVYFSIDVLYNLGFELSNQSQRQKIVLCFLNTSNIPVREHVLIFSHGYLFLFSGFIIYRVR